MKYVLLLRGINVGGNNKLPMKDLQTLLEKRGASDVTTVIQSGNVVLESGLAASQLAGETQKAIDGRFGFSPEIMVLSAEQYLAAVKGNPFPDAESEPKTLHAFFAHENIVVNQDALKKYKASSESVHLSARALWLHAPDGVGRSKLMSNISKITQCDTTARNWNTLSKLRDLLTE